MSQSARAEEAHEAFEGFERLPRETVGILLARARQEIGQSVADVATNLRIRRVYLQAIEEGRYAELPGATYAVGFVRSYADYLGLDSEYLVERFKGEIAGMDRRQQLHFPAPKPDGRIPGGALILVSLLLIGLAYGGWHYATQNALLDGLLGRGDGVPSTALPDAPPADAPPADAPPAEAPQVAGRGATPAEGAARTPSAERAAPPQPAATPAPTTAEAPSASEAGGFTERMESAAAEQTVLPNTGLPQTPAPPMGQTPAAGVTPLDRAAALRALQANETAPERPDAAPPPEPAQPAVAEAAEAAPSERGGASQAEPATPGDIATAATETLEPDIPAAPEVPTQTAATDGRVYGAVNEDSRVTLTATADSWVQVRSADDNLLITRVLRAGDIYRVPNQDGLVLETGNAGGLRIVVDGRTAPPLGGPGDVVRGVSLEPQALLSGRARQ